MNGNWDQLIRAIVPLSFLAIWALTSLFNRESKAFPARPAGPQPAPGPRPGEPTLRWGPTAPPPPTGPRRVAIGDDDILIIPPDPARAARPGQARPLAGPQAGPRRGAKARPAAPAGRRAEPVAPARMKLADVNQNVNQHLTQSTLDLAPLSAMPPSATSTTLGLSTSPMSHAAAVLPTVSSLTNSLADPVRLREAFMLNEILQPPVALRGRRARHR